ncbi:hypothetical protein FRB98_009700 [Tulasnella sp. 332]|nr:hypothetical protein FRB98_009700 [Tulasnella sp. 332]
MIAPSRTTPNLLQLNTQAMIVAIEYAAVVELQADKLPETVFTQADHGVPALNSPPQDHAHAAQSLGLGSLGPFRPSATGPLPGAISRGVSADSDLEIEGEEAMDDDSLGSEANKGRLFSKMTRPKKVSGAGILPSVESDDEVDAEGETY